MSLLTNFDTNSNFWKVNPQLTIPKVLSDLHKGDKSKDKTVSSNIMWAICLFLDLSEDNKFRNFPEEDRKKLIIEDFLQDPKFKFDAYKSIIDWYTEGMYTPAERGILNWRKKLEERDQFISETPYDLDNAEKMDKILAGTDKLYSQLERLEKQYQKEQLKGQDKGGATASLSDKNLI